MFDSPNHVFDSPNPLIRENNTEEETITEIIVTVHFHQPFYFLIQIVI